MACWVGRAHGHESPVASLASGQSGWAGPHSHPAGCAHAQAGIGWGWTTKNTRAIARAMREGGPCACQTLPYTLGPANLRPSALGHPPVHGISAAAAARSVKRTSGWPDASCGAASPSLSQACAAAEAPPLRTNPAGADKATETEPAVAALCPVSTSLLRLRSTRPRKPARVQARPAPRKEGSSRGGDPPRT